jgi:hypothetical protein
MRLTGTCQPVTASGHGGTDAPTQGRQEQSTQRSEKFDAEEATRADGEEAKKEEARAGGQARRAGD